MKFIGKLVAIVGKILLPTSRKRLEILSSIASQEYRQRLRHQMPVALTQALIAGEDRRFCRHSGIDPIAIAGAFWRLVRSGQLSGASTIEQQLVRVLTGDRRRTLGRKMREIILACVLATEYEKREIAGMYMAVAYFGWRMNGVENACGRLRINMPEATLRQAAALVARLKYPEPRRPSIQRCALIARRTEHLLALLSNTEIVAAKEIGSDAAVLDT